jgi:hypothetical protein
MILDWVSFLAYSNLFGIKDFVVVVVVKTIQYYFQAYASLTPTVHVVNVQSGGTESCANVTVCSVTECSKFCGI